MLVLTRKIEESIVNTPGGGAPRVITVKVLGIRGGKVRLGFEADAGILVRRGEVWHRLHGGDVVASPPAANVHQPVQANETRGNIFRSV